MLRIYLDDVRLVSTILEEGYRFSSELGKLVHTKEAAAEDERLRLEGESAEARMVRVLLPAMCSQHKPRPEIYCGDQ